VDELNQSLDVGLGFRLGLAEPLLEAESSHASFLEIAPENYLGVGGRRRRLLDEAHERWPIVSHGLCGDLAGRADLDRELLGQLKEFLADLDARWYSDHLCLTHLAGAETHDLVPLAFNEDNIARAAQRIREVQSILDLPLAIENVSAYGRMPGGTMSEAQFVAEVVDRADCYLLLDVNNVYVNCTNFDLDPYAYLDELPLDRVLEIHIAGHDAEDDGLLLDTHASAVADPVYDLFRHTLSQLDHRPPVLLERDGNFPPLADLEAEMQILLEILHDVDAAA
jgi:uncharacterized protein (UPF0276 family)